MQTPEVPGGVLYLLKSRYGGVGHFFAEARGCYRVSPQPGEWLTFYLMAERSNSLTIRRRRGRERGYFVKYIYLHDADQQVVGGEKKMNGQQSSGQERGVGGNDKGTESISWGPGVGGLIG